MNKSVPLMMRLGKRTNMRLMSNEVTRQYFYFLDYRGQVFLHETKHRNFVTSIKDKGFLNFFFRQLRRRSPADSSEVPMHYSLLSPCGREVNYVEIDDGHAASVFSSLQKNDKDRTSLTLSMGHSDIKQAFDPSLLCVDAQTGRFYHEIIGHRHLQGDLGLLHVQVSEQLSSRISLGEGEEFVFRGWDDSRTNIRQIT